MPKARRTKAKEEKPCDAMVDQGNLVCRRGGYCSDPRMWDGECAHGHRGQRPETNATEVGPGDQLQVTFGRLPSGEWYGSIGGAADEEAIAQTSAFPWEVLRGLAAQVKRRAEELVRFRMDMNPDEMGRCPHASQDGTRCELLQCPSGGAEAVVRMLQETREAMFTGAPIPTSSEIVRLCGLMKEPRLVGKGEDEGDVLTATFEITGDDLTPEFRYLRPSAKKQVVAIVYHALAAPSGRSARPDQLDIFNPPPEGGDRVSCQQGEEGKQAPAEGAEQAPEQAADQPEMQGAGEAAEGTQAESEVEEQKEAA